MNKDEFSSGVPIAQRRGRSAVCTECKANVACTFDNVALEWFVVSHPSGSRRVCPGSYLKVRDGITETADQCAYIVNDGAPTSGIQCGWPRDNIIHDLRRPGSHTFEPASVEVER